MKRILIADDDFIECRTLKQQLERFLDSDWEIIAAKNGREAFSLYRRVEPSIMILDIEMPVMNGLQVAHRVREIDRACQIIFLTAHDDFAYARKAIGVRALEYLLKPCTGTELQAAVEEAIYLTENKVLTLPIQDASLDSYSRKMTYQPQYFDEDDEQFHEQSGLYGLPVVRESDRTKETLKSTTGIKAKQERIRRFIEENYSKDMSLQMTATHFGYADAYFCKLFHEYFGKSYVTYLTEFRVEKAKELIRSSDYTIRDIGKMVGYPDSNYFAKVFRRLVGVTPSEYRHSGME